MEHTLLAASIVLALINLIAVIVLGLKLRDARDWAATLTRMLNTARDEATTAKLERNKLILEQNADALNKVKQQRQTFSPRPEPSRARPGTPGTSNPVIDTAAGTTFAAWSANNDCSPSTSSSTDSGSCGGGE